MRVSTAMQYNNHLGYLQSANSKVDLASQRYNTGKLFQTAGENPGGMSASMKYQADIAAYKQYGLNSKIVADSLAQEETALGQIYDTMSSIQTRLIQAINGTLDDGSRAALAEDIKQMQAQLFNTMNTKNAEGEYIFSGAQSAIPTFRLTSDGKYICQADGSSKNVNVSPTLQVQVTDSGLNIFENVNLANDFAFTATNNGQPKPGYQASISDYDQFNALYDKYYDSGTGGQANGNNTLKIEVLADNKFQLTDQAGNVIDSGEIKDGKIQVQGMEFEIPGGQIPAQGDTINVTLQDPKTDNILNQLTDVIAALNTPLDQDPTKKAEVTRQLVKMQENISIAKKQVDTYRGLVGARGANIDDIIKSNESLHDIKTEANANVSEIDAFQAVSDLLVTQNALQVAQQSYNIVHSATLFDFM
ncbi:MULTISPECIES: flagellar hook-associated protein FlgL [unclassified Anaerobiospirillum]|uniref:flagellar hook-associated protein FlgL n=1 Tax=unclassified Anaerobiospirillum TaxID=2647410 RepID=UPI001FF3FE70|nr:MULTISPECIES: flagellar hook-associated protein FlgL [unclassified Anaerobiospirillum]MCK0534964.1 flagellar hook-associated protein FlgL [Anaerobiospirillum sp. NML120511]MCK0540405.1 flagellar hook-associated protein FlgL [Anaerobiospirillum sp. NML02-A-032]